MTPGPAARLTDERGSGTVLLLVSAGLLLLAVLVALGLGSVTLARHRAQSAADLAALAAADRLGRGPAGEPCRVASQVAAANGVRVESCTEQQESVLVVVTRRARLPRLLGGGLTVRAGARAGREPPPGSARPTRHGAGGYRDVTGRMEFQA
ncbi:MAG: hypothetical protein QOJ92_2650 [Frankiales bacterium]|nr:hypothetical protein [Frankiales bacterium]